MTLNISTDKAEAKLKEFLAENERLMSLSYEQGRTGKSALDTRIRNFARAAFSDSQQKIKSYTGLVFAIGGRERTPQEKQDDYNESLGRKEQHLKAWLEEVELNKDSIPETAGNSKEAVNGASEKEHGDQLSNKVFIVHGHDENLKQEVEIFLKDIGLEPIVLHRQPDKGQTIIEKFENNSEVGYALILLTPDDVGYPVSQETEGSDVKKRQRARQNVIFEFGYFVGKLGRSRVCCIYKEGVELPTDISGVIYKKVTTNIEEIGMSIIKDLKAVGYTIKIS